MYYYKRLSYTSLLCKAAQATCPVPKVSIILYDDRHRSDAVWRIRCHPKCDYTDLHYSRGHSRSAYNSRCNN